MSDLLATVPWPQAGIVAGCSFALGFLLGRWDRNRSRTLKERTMNDPLPPSRRDRLGELYRRWLGSIVLIGFFLSCIGIWIGVAAVITNGRQDAAAAAANKARDEETSRLQGCFDDFATNLSGGLPPVRKATAERDAATGERDDALQLFVAVLIEAVADPEPGTDVEADRLDRFGRAVIRLDSAGRRLDTAQATLERVRGENPYPPPPSTFCGIPD